MARAMVVWDKTVINLILRNVICIQSKIYYACSNDVRIISA